jgi:hypothetical protein
MSSRAVARAGITVTIPPVVETPVFLAGLFRRQKRETRPGGQPDGSSHMGAWGGWALAPNTAFDGEG